MFTFSLQIHSFMITDILTSEKYEDKTDKPVCQTDQLNATL